MFWNSPTLWLEADDSSPTAPALSLSRNIIFNYLGRAYSVGATYLFIPFYVSILGVEAYGIIAFYSVVVTFVAIADAGLSVAFAREIARGADRTRLVNLLSTIEVLLGSTTVALACTFFLSADWIAKYWLNQGEKVSAQDVVMCLRLMALSVPAQLLISLYSAGLFGSQRQHVGNLMQAAYTTARSGLVILVLMQAPSVVTFFAWHLLATLVFAVLFRASLLRVLGARWLACGRFVPAELRSVLAFAGGMLAISVVSLVNTQLDKVMVSKLFSIEQFGLYALAAMLAQLPVAVSTPVAMAFSPAMTALVAKGKTAEYERMYERFSALIALLGSLSAFGLAFFAGDVFAVWLAGQAVSGATLEVAMVMVLGGLFLCLQLTPYYLSLANGDNRSIAALAAATLVLSMPLTYLGATKFGLLGAATPWLLLNCINFFTLSAVVNGRHYPGRHRRWLWRCIGMPVLMAASCMFMLKSFLVALELNAAIRCGLVAALSLVVMYVYLYVAAPAAARVE